MSPPDRAQRYAARRKRAQGSSSPLQISAVAAWLRLAQGTVTGAGFSSVPDLLASNPAVQGTDGSRPPLLLSANGLPTADFDGTADVLSWPAAANNSQTVTHGFAAWVKFDTVLSSLGALFCNIPGAANRAELLRNLDDLFVDVYISQFSSRRGTIADVFVAGTWYFITWEYDGGGADDAAKCTLTINGVVQTLTFSNSSGAPGAMPATLVSPGGAYFFGGRNATPLSPLDGKLGPNWYILGSKMAGATQGLLTTAGRAFLMNLEAPT